MFRYLQRVLDIVKGESVAEAVLIGRPCHRRLALVVQLSSVANEVGA